MASLWERWSQDASHALQDIYGNLVLGDDTGQSSRLVLVVQPQSTASATSNRNPGSSRRHSHSHTMNHPHATSSSSTSMLGLEFCEINGRAYVQSVEPGSRAEREGILPKDCVHYAAVLAKEWKDPLKEPDHGEIRKRALDREMTGQRISYLEFKRLLQTGNTSTIMDSTANAAANAAHANGTTPGNAATTATSAAAFLSPSVPTTIQVGGGTNPCGPLRSANSSPTVLLPPGAEPRPVVLVFRRTKQRPSSAFLPIWPNFRLDDECDEACRILKSLAQDDSNNNNDDGNNNEEENVEAATIRGMIQKAVGLAFLRTNKVVLGVSLHAGSGLVLARLPDGTWSAPSAIGIAGVGLGLQLGVEVAHSIIVLQTKEALEHFQRGGSFTVGANVGAAVGGLGREAVGAASVSGALCGGAAHVVDIVKDDEYHADTYTHEPPSYPFSYSSYLAGANSTKSTSSPSSSLGVAPLVAYAKSQGLYVGVSLEGSRISGRNQVNARAYQFDTHKAVTAHDLLTGKVAPPPEAEGLYAALHEVEFTHELKSLPRPPKSLRTTMGQPWHASGTTPSSSSSSSSSLPPLELKECAEFNQSVRQFLYGGVYVWRVRGRKRERRTLWLYVPEAGAPLRIGFVSKLSNLETTTNNSLSKGRTSSSEQQQDHRSVTSEELTLDSALVDNQSLILGHPVRTQVELSRKHSIALTDVCLLTQSVPEDVVVLEDPMEVRRVISLETATQQLIFVAPTDQEAQLLVCGLKLLLETETKRCGIRGGSSIGKDSSTTGTNTSSSANKKSSRKKKRTNKSLGGYSSSEMEDNDNDDASAMSFQDLPEGSRSWGRVPGRSFLRGQASANDQGYPHYVHGQLLVRDIAKNFHLPLPLPLCRVLLLDSSSPVISQWEQDRGDVEFEKTPWTFPPATPREGDQYQSEHQLIASGSMCGAHRTSSYERPRNGQLVRLFETQIVDSDDSEKLAFQIHERMPRRGFSIKVKILLRAYNHECEATVLAEIRPVGKNMSNPAAVHKAFLLVIDELRERYGPDGRGLLAGFLNAVDNFKEEDLDLPPHMNRSFRKSGLGGEEKKEQDAATNASVVKLEDMLKANSNLGVPDSPEPKFLQDRPSTPSPMDVDKYREYGHKNKPPAPSSDTFDAPSSDAVMIEVKPLPKIRLSLMPSPREEDEVNSDDEAEAKKKKSLGSTASKSKRSRKSWGKKRRSRKVKV